MPKLTKGKRDYQHERRLERERIFKRRVEEKRRGGLNCDRCNPPPGIPDLREPATYCGFCEIELGLAPAR